MLHQLKQPPVDIEKCAEMGNGNKYNKKHFFLLIFIYTDYGHSVVYIKLEKNKRGIEVSVPILTEIHPD